MSLAGWGLARAGEALLLPPTVALGLLFLGSFAAIFSRRPELRWLSAGILLYCFYLFYIQRMNEDRYIVPMLPVIFVCGSVWWVYLRRWLRSN